MAIALRPFQRRFVAAALRPSVDSAVLSVAHGNGKSWLAAHLVARALIPGDPLFQPNGRHHGLARTIEVPTDAAAAPPSGAPRLRLGPLLTVDTPSPPPNPHSAPPAPSDTT